MTVFRSLSSLVRVLSGVLVLGVASTACLLWRYQGLLVYPASFPQGSRTIVDTPDKYGLPFEEITLTTPDGESVRCFVILQRAPSEKEKAAGLSGDGDDTARRRPTVLFFHANAGNMGHRLPIAAVFYRRFGANVVMLSYRGYGLSTGTPSERGIRVDAQTLMDWVRAHPVLRSTHLIVYGQSLGGAVAVDVASRPSNEIAAVILENTFLSIPELIPHVLPPLRPFTFLCREIWATGNLIRQLRMPVLFLSGRDDQLVPPSHMDALYQRCPSKNKVFKPFDDGTHNDTCIKPGYFEEISNFLMKFIVPLPPRPTDSSIEPQQQQTSGVSSAAELHADLRRRTGQSSNLPASQQPQQESTASTSAARERAPSSGSVSIISGATSPSLIDDTITAPGEDAKGASETGGDESDGEGTGSDWVEMSITDASEARAATAGANPSENEKKGMSAVGLAPKDTVAKMLAEEEAAKGKKGSRGKL
ncbi:bem46 protein, variant [Tilletia horrida]|uniref:Bem46 protein, variant n=1 Tax=Tilletia horrida TaxID=155126 RepID=A0AAN6GR03_9BASI|nr:bem46 protein, variant [Tilletia horrida]KAK0546482.1 bem46 protein, variant [Tilletia horrida]